MKQTVLIHYYTTTLQHYYINSLLRVHVYHLNRVANIIHRTSVVCCCCLILMHMLFDGPLYQYKRIATCDVHNSPSHKKKVIKMEMQWILDNPHDIHHINRKHLRLDRIYMIRIYMTRIYYSVNHNSCINMKVIHGQ